MIYVSTDNPLKTITFHRNLNATNGRAWSVKNPLENDGRPVQYAYVYAEGVTIKQPSGKKFEQCLEGGNRSVFAWFKTNTLLEVANAHPRYLPESVKDRLRSNAVRVRFNPKNGDKAFHVDGRVVNHLEQVWCLPNGECWAVLYPPFIEDKLEQ